MRVVKVFLNVVLVANIISCSAENSSDRPQQGEKSSKVNPLNPDQENAQPTFDPMTETPSVRKYSSDAVSPSLAFYSRLLAKYLGELNQNSTSLTSANIEDDSHVLYLDFDGATISKGISEGESFIVCEGDAEIPSANLSSTEIIDLTNRVQTLYDAANAKVIVVTEKPVAGNFTTMMVGGEMSDLNCDKDDNVLGIAPLDIANLSDNDIGYVFYDHLSKYSDPALATSIVIAHEAGHSFGLNHIVNTAAIMHASLQTGAVDFGKGRVTSMPWVVQNSPQVLRKNLGKKIEDGKDDDEVPEIDMPDFSNLPKSRQRICKQVVKLQNRILGTFSTFFTGTEKIFDLPKNCQ